MLLCQVTWKARTKIEVKLFLLNFLSLSGQERQLHQTLFHWSFITPRSDIGFTSCQGSPSDKISRLTGKPLQINESYQGIYLQLCCLVGSNFRNLNSLVSLKVGLSRYSWDKTWKLKKTKTKEKQNKGKTKNFYCSLEFTLKCSSLEISCQINFNVVVYFRTEAQRGYWPIFASYFSIF